MPTARALNKADLYGKSWKGVPKGEPTTTAAASGQVPMLPKGPAVAWLGIIIALVLLRVLYELAPSAVPGK